MVIMLDNNQSLVIVVNIVILEEPRCGFPELVVGKTAGLMTKETKRY